MPGECQGYVWEWVKSARECCGMQGNTRETYGSGCKMPGEYRVMQGNASGTYGSGCRVPRECRELSGECKGASVKC